jgi:phosphopantothenoylcysteine decarboxylase/phosphopantothenate--cysteine ligase
MTKCTSEIQPEKRNKAKSLICGHAQNEISMKTIQGKKIILGVCGSIAAYKAAFLLRLLTKAGAEVQVVLTPDAANFVGPLTFSTLSSRPVLVDYFDQKTGEWNNHVHLALWADLILIAPLTANTLSKFAHGGCDNLLTAIYLSARSPVYFAPAMDLDMWHHPATKKNIETLISYGNVMIAPNNGALASGLEGEGRLAEPEEIVAVVEDFFSNGNSTEKQLFTSQQTSEKSQFLAGKRVLVTAGPTYEAIDPVRFIGNHSTGKMGVALAKELANRGAQVYLVHGPISVPIPNHPNIHATAVTSAAEMLSACEMHFSKVNLLIMAAAVADYTPQVVAAEKIKKEANDQGGLHLELKKTVDILSTLSAKKSPGQFLVGFALETQQEEEHARSKMIRKHLDMIVLNSLRDPGAGFATDTNQVTVFHKNGEKKAFPLASKSDTAGIILDEIAAAWSSES